MTTEISSNPAPTAGAASEAASSNVETSSATTTTPDSGAPLAAGASPDAPVVPAYTPNFKYKAALQEKELDPFFHSLVKDPESEKRVKELFTKVDAFDFVKQKKEALEAEHGSLRGDYEAVNETVSRFNQAVKNDDLSSAFRVAGITKDQVFKWAQRQIALMDMPPEQRQQLEQSEQIKEQKYSLEQQVANLQKQYETQSVQARTTQLEMALGRPQVAQFAEAWDNQSGEPGAFRQFVVDEAKKVFFETNEDMSPEKAVNYVMQRFAKFLNVGQTAGQPPQAGVVQSVPQNAKPVIPNITGKASSPIKQVPRSLDDLKKIAKSLPG